MPLLKVNALPVNFFEADNTPQSNGKNTNYVPDNSTAYVHVSCTIIPLMQSCNSNGYGDMRMSHDGWGWIVYLSTFVSARCVMINHHLPDEMTFYK